MFWRTQIKLCFLHLTILVRDNVKCLWQKRGIPQAMERCKAKSDTADFYIKMCRMVLRRYSQCFLKAKCNLQAMQSGFWRSSKGKWFDILSGEYIHTYWKTLQVNLYLMVIYSILPLKIESCVHSLCNYISTLSTCVFKSRYFDVFLPQNTWPISFWRPSKTSALLVECI